MGLFFQELAKKLADKWLSMLVLPGLLLLATFAVATTLGHRGWADVDRLVVQAGDLVRDLNARGTVAAVLTVIALLLASSAAGLAAFSAGCLIQRLWLGQWPVWTTMLATSLTNRRQRRWESAQQRFSAAHDRIRDGCDDQASLDRTADARNQIALVKPSRPTWIGDRIVAVDRRVYIEYELDLASAWPRLWLVIPDSTRAELRAAGEGFNTTATLGGWGFLYMLAGLLWWPAAIIGLITYATAWRRGRAAISLLADLAEATVDLHGLTLAHALGFRSETGRLTSELGNDITACLRKGT